MTLPCSAQPSSSETIRYRWTLEGVVLGEQERVQGALTIPAVSEDSSDNGQYECSLVISVDSLDATPLLVSVGTTILSVGGEN